MARPTEFNRETVLQNAMHLFWQKGYAATSMSDLIAAMNMRPGSIYGAFGNKQALLLEAMTHYAETGQREIREQLLDPGKPKKETLKRLFSCMIQEMTDKSNPAQGCLLINMLLELSNIDEEAGACARKHLEGMKSIFKETLSAAQQSGELSSKRKAEELATFLLGTVYSLRVMGRTAATKKDLTTIATHALDHVFEASAQN